MKVGTLIVLGGLPYLNKIGELIVGWTKGNTALQIIFVMFVRPLSPASLLVPICTVGGTGLMVDLAVGLEYVAVFDCGRDIVGESNGTATAESSSRRGVYR